MADATRTVTVKLRWELSGGQVRAIDQATGAVRALINAEGALGKEMIKNNNLRDESARKSRQVQPPTVEHLADQFQERQRVQRAVEAELRRRGAIQDPAAATPADLARQVVERRRQRDAVAAELQAQGLDAAGNPLGQAPAERGWGATALIGAASYAATAAPQLIATAGNQQRNPYTSARTRAEEFYRSPPVYGQAFGAGVDIARNLSGESQRIGDLTRRADEQGVRQSLENALAGRAGGLRREEGEAFRRAQAFGSTTGLAGMEVNRLAGPYAGPGRAAGVDRATVAGQRQYEEESRLLPVRREMAKLDRERAAAGKLVTDSANREQRLTEDLARIDRERAKAREEYEAAGKDTGVTGTGVGVNRQANELQALNRAKELDDQRRGVQAQLEAEQDVGKGARLRSAELEARRRQLDIQASREQLGIAREKEQQAGDKSVALSQMGVGGREAAKAALDMARQFGIDALPPELRDAARAAAPDTVRRMEMEDGDRYKEELKPFADEGERGFDRDADARRRTDEAERKVLGQEDSAAQADAQGIADSIKGFADKVVATVKAAIQAEVEALTVDRMRGNLSGGG